MNDLANATLRSTEALLKALARLNESIARVEAQIEAQAQRSKAHLALD